MTDERSETYIVPEGNSKLTDAEIHYAQSTYAESCYINVFVTITAK